MDKVNCAIPLTETQIEVLLGSQKPRSMPAEATMRLSPTPRVFIEITLPYDLLLSTTNMGRPGTRLKLRLPHNVETAVNPEIEAEVVRVRGEVPSSCLMTTRQPVTVVETRENLRSVRFNLINFSTLAQVRNPALLEAEPWRIEIKPLPELFNIKTVLKAESGFALTHEGSIRRSDGESFSAEEAHKLLDVLHLFLSFARGGNCGITLIVGIDEHGEKGWEQWGTYSTYPWYSLSCWLDHRQNNDCELSMVWPVFWRKIKKATGAQDDPTRIALYWYLRSNESNNPYSGIILTQAALVRLANQILPQSEYKSLKQKKKAEEKMIRAVLQQSKIDCAIPDSLQNLKDVNLQLDGPAILTDLRNDLVHSEMNCENVSLEAYLQAWNLGQWYVELFLLNLFEYKGKYANRITYNYKGIYQPEVVPWVQH